MKKYMTLTLFLMMIISSTCFASVTREQMTLGGIYLGASPEYVKSIYGAPQDVHIGGLFYETDTYGDSVHIIYDFKGDIHGPLEVVGMETTANNGFATKDGVTVGMNQATVRRIYGVPDRIFTRYGQTDIYHMQGRDYIDLIFDYDKKGIIKRIYSGNHD